MTRIVPYRIAFTSSEDDDATASELLSPGPSSRGWASDKYCTYPQASNTIPSYFSYIQVMCRDQTLRELRANVISFFTICVNHEVHK